MKWELAPAPTAGQIVWKKDGRTDGPTDGQPEEKEGGRESAVNREKSLNVTHQGMEEELQSGKLATPLLKVEDGRVNGADLNARVQ